MKNSLLLPYIVTIIFSVSLLCCSGTHDPRLLHVESRIDADPDSALVILEKIDPMSLKSDGDRAYHSLLLLESLNKTGTQRETSSLERTVTSYYIERNKEPELHQRVYYALGRMHVEKKEYPQALMNFRKSLLQKQENPDSNLLIRTHAQMAGVFVDNKLYRHAMIHTREQERLATNLGDTAAMINAALWKAREYHYLDDPDSVRIVYSYISPIIQKYHRRGYEIWLGTQYASFLMDHKEYEKADSILRSVHINEAEVSSVSVKNVLNRLNLHFGRLEDVGKISKRLLDEDHDPYTLKTAARNLAVVSLEKGNVREALEYTDRFFNIVDSISTADVATTVVELEKLYSFSETEQEKADLEKKNMELRRDKGNLLIFLVASGMLAVIIFLIFRQRSIKRELSIMKENERLENEREKMEQEREELLEKNEGMQKEKEELFRDYEGIQKEREELMESLEKVTKDRDHKAQLISSTTENADEKALVAELTAPLHKGGDRKKSLKKLRLHVGNTYPEFYKAVDNLGLNYDDFNDALLIKVGLSISESASVMDVDYNALVNRRYRLAGRHHIKELGFKVWGDYILSFGK